MLGCVEDQCPRLYQVFLSILTVIFFNNQTHAAYTPAMSVFHYGMFEVKLMNNIYIAVFFHPALGKDWLFSFIFSIHRFWLVIQSALRGVIRLFYTHCFCLFGIFHPFYWNHHFGIQSDEICTLLTKRIAYTFKWSYGILDTGQIYWMLDSVHDTCESKTWVPNVCPKIHPACGPLQNMQASSAIVIMPPSPLNTAFSFSCTWSWLRAANTFAFLWININGHITDIYTRYRICTEDSQPALYCESDPSSKTTQFQYACPSFPPSQAYHLLTILYIFFVFEAHVILINRNH